MKKNNKKILLIIFIVILVIVGGFFGTLYYMTSIANNYNYAEKKWINSNINTTIDVYVEKSLPIFSSDGSGVYYDYLTDLKNDTGLTFNIVTSNESSVKLVNNNSNEKTDLVFYKDHYVVISNKNNINKITDLGSKSIGILSNDEESLKYYFTDYKNITFKTYSTINGLIDAYGSSNIDYIIIPMYKYMDKIISEDLSIVYHIDGLNSYYKLSFNEADKTLVDIMTKFYNRWQKQINEKVNEYFLDSFYDSKNYTELEKESIIEDDFIVGYVQNLPYEGMIHNDFAGVTNTYLSKFASMTGVTYKYVEYDNSQKLNDALSNKKIDIAMNYYSLSNDNYDNSKGLGATDYVVLAHTDNNLVVNSLYSLSKKEVSMLSSMNLKYNMASKSLFDIKEYKTVKELLKGVDKDSIIIIDKEVYDYYKDGKLKNYSIRYMDSMKLNNSFLLLSTNTSFNKLFNFYLGTLSSNEINNESVDNTIDTFKENRIINFILTNILIIVVVLSVLIVFGVMFYKKTKNTKKIKKEDRLYYFDAMTNLKNRNYLNDNIDFWSSTKVYPQAIVVIDINSLGLLNDRKGHEAGDRQIKAVANVLIRTQRDNSEIMRTDGDEFMVYLVGYDEKKIGSYIHKLNRELNSALPDKSHGISLGYSMILNEQTTIDDAINDSLLMIKKSKKVQ